MFACKFDHSPTPMPLFNTKVDQYDWKQISNKTAFRLEGTYYEFSQRIGFFFVLYIKKKIMNITSVYHQYLDFIRYIYTIKQVIERLIEM